MTMKQTSTDILKGLVAEGMKMHYGDKPEKEVKLRILWELKHIIDAGFVDYYVMAFWIFRHMAQSMKIGAWGRGAMPSSIVCYCLGLTNIEPIKCGLRAANFVNDEVPKFQFDIEESRFDEFMKGAEELLAANANEYDIPAIRQCLFKYIKPYERLGKKRENLDKVQGDVVRHAHIVPSIDIPQEFGNSEDMCDEYLKYLSFSRAKQIYGKELPEEVSDRLNYELLIIKQSGAADYFLFIQDIVNTAQSKLGVCVGPGRGSAAGSLVNYCLGITKIDPLKHNLLFERFMSPNGTTFPDIDLDFDEEGRLRVLDWLKQKYGEECFAHIVTEYGIHQCGFIVANEPISKWVPVMVANTEDDEGNPIRMNCISYEGSRFKESGLVEFDILGLRTLSMMKDIILKIRDKGVSIEIERIPVDDAKTFELFQRGDTEGVFQFEAQGMRDYLRELHPTTFEDLVLLNAMYRPGLMEDIPPIIKMKNGECPIKYALPCMEKYLHETYGMIIYQEQIMQLSRLIADFTRYESEILRKAIGKQQTDVLPVLKVRFMEGGIKNGHTKEALEKVWNEMVQRGRCAFNKSHAVCYTWLAYQMAYLKANYPEEFKQVKEES